MKKSIKKSVSMLAIVAVLAVSLSSCNRGMGCPNNFSLEQTVDIMFNGAADAVID